MDPSWTLFREYCLLLVILGVVVWGHAKGAEEPPAGRLVRGSVGVSETRAATAEAEADLRSQ